MANPANNGVALATAAGPAASPPQTGGPDLSPEVDAFISQMVEALNTHQHGVPRGMNTGNCPQPEFSPRPGGPEGVSEHQPPVQFP